MSDEVKSFTEYGVFEDSVFWEPLFASGELPETMRHIITDPKDGSTGLSLYRAQKWADLQNEGRARDILKVDRYGLMIVKKRFIVEHPWVLATQEEIEAAKRT